MTALATPDGVWRVELCRFVDHEEFKVTWRGVLSPFGVPGRRGTDTDQGRCTSIEEVALVLGDAFAQLQAVS